MGKLLFFEGKTVDKSADFFYNIIRSHTCVTLLTRGIRAVMKLDVSDAIRFPGTEYKFSVVQTIAPQEMIGEQITYDDATLTGTFTATDEGHVTVDVRIQTIAHSRCANCLAPAAAPLEVSCRETFMRDGDPEDDEIFTYTGYQVDLEKLTMSYAVMATPMRFLCKEDCEGVAEWTDADQDVCFCQKELPGQRPFAALQQLLAENADKVE